MAVKIGIFGGSFNPPHIGHQLSALYLVETGAVDEVWFVPVYTHAFGKQLAPFDARIAMCEMLAGPLGAAATVLRAEEEVAKRPDLVAGRTLDLLTYVGEQWPGHELRLVIGADILGETPKWHRWDDVVRKAPPLVIGRAGFPLASGASETGIEMPRVSATAVRELLAQLSPQDRAHLALPFAQQDPAVATELRALLPKTVLWYIARSGLYSS